MWCVADGLPVRVIGVSPLVKKSAILWILSGCLLLFALAKFGFLGRSTYDAINHNNIEFYGLIVDQNGQPVSDATVFITVLYNSTFGSGQKQATLQSGIDGHFKVVGYKGRTLDIGLRKEGYDYAGDVGPFHLTGFVSEAERYHPDKQNPIRFVMWKRKGAEPMVKCQSYEVRMPWDGTEKRVDFLKGCVVKEGGDLIIQLTADPLTPEESKSGKKWNWDLICKPVDGGGFLQSKTKLMSEAPENGYLPQMNLGRETADPLWNGQAMGDFFILSRGKLYTKLHLYFTGNPAFGTGGLSLQWQTNPSGSRNLEYDKAKDVTKEYQELKH